MIAAPLLVRITDTVGRAHDVNLELLELADELREYAARAVGETARLQKAIKPSIDQPGVTVLPRMLRSGPKRESGPEYPSDAEPPREIESA